MAYVVGATSGTPDASASAQPPIHPLLVGIEMAPEIDVEIAAAEDRAEPIGERTRIVAANQRARNRTERAAGEADQAGAEAFEIIERDAALALGGILRRTPLLDFDGIKRPQLGGGDHPAQISIALAIGHQHVEPLIARLRGRPARRPRLIERQFRADDRLIPARSAAGKSAARRKLRRGRPAPAPGSRVRRRARPGPRAGRAFEKAERAARAQLDIIRH